MERYPNGELKVDAKRRANDYAAALRRLKAAHPEEFQRYYEEERAGYSGQAENSSF